MTTGVVLRSHARHPGARLRREATELETAIAFVAGRPVGSVLLCGLHHSARLLASHAACAAAAGVSLEPVGRSSGGVDIRVRRA